MTINKHIPRPFKKSFGKDLYDRQRREANYKDGSLKRVKHPRGAV